MKGEWLRKSTGPMTVVFVHGILSRSDSAWHGPHGSSWPELLREENDLSDAGIYLFDYRTALTSGGYRIEDIVDELRERFHIDNVLEARVLVFVCHSMGGLVVRKYFHERAVYLREPGRRFGLFLVASPSLGSELADWVSSLLSFIGHKQLEVLGTIRRNPWLADLNRAFRSLKDSGVLSIEGKELIEDKMVFLPPWFSTIVARSYSAGSLFADPYVVLGSDHFSIAKPATRASDQHRILVRFLADMKARASAEKQATVPDDVILVRPNNEEVDSLSYAPTQAVLPFTVTNLTSQLVKVLSLRLSVLRRNTFDKVQLADWGAPHERYPLNADISTALQVDLLAGVDSDFLLEPRKTQSYALCITGAQGIRYSVRIQCTSESLPSLAKTTSFSPEVVVKFPISTARGFDRAQ